MPYATNEELPEPIRNALPRAAQDVFRSAYNRAAQGGASESKAMGYAWVAVKNGWKKNGNNQKWVRKNMLQKGNNDLTNENQSDIDTHNSLEKAEYQGRQVTLDKPFRTPGESKKFAVYVKDGDTVKIVRFGDPDMEIRRDDPEARANFRARHSCDTATDKTTPRYWSCKLWSNESVSDLTKVNITSEIFKSDEEQRIVYGWASIITKKGEPVVDSQGDVIEASELIKATTDFMKSVRMAKQMHVGDQIGTVVHSFPLTNDIAKSLGIETENEGWIVGMHIEDDEVWKSVRSGKLKSFSIAGSALREEIVN